MPGSGWAPWHAALLNFASADLLQFAVCICVKSWPEAARQEAKRLLYSFSLGFTCARALLTRPMAGSACSLACWLMPDNGKTRLYLACWRQGVGS